MKPACYAQRLLNPFRGVMNIIEYQGAEAVTTDGFHWDIYVRDMTLVEDLANSRKVQTSDIRYGSWSPEQGLKRGALYPSEDFKQLEMLGARVYEYLLDHHDCVPFTLRDHYELWLLDRSHRPLALLNSALYEDAIEFDCPIDWRAGHDCRKTFTPALAEQPLRMDEPDNAGDYLTRLINTTAGPEPRAQWFRRSADGYGHGVGGINLPADLEMRSLPCQAFPDFHLRLPDASPAQRQLLEAFFDWQAPCLLLLADLTGAQRAYYEQHAVRRARAVDRHYRLYPEILDIEAIRAARVEALIRASETTSDAEDEVMATYYIELNVTRTN